MSLGDEWRVGVIARPASALEEESPDVFLIVSADEPLPFVALLLGVLPLEVRGSEDGGCCLRDNSAAAAAS